MSTHDHNVQTVDVLEDVVDLLPVDGQVIHVLGSVTVGDGGEGLYRYELGSSVNCDGRNVLDGPAGENFPPPASYPGDSTAGRYLSLSTSSKLVANTQMFSNVVVFNLSASQVACGFTMDHVTGVSIVSLSGTAPILGGVRLENKTPTSIEYRLSATEDENDGSEVTLHLLK